MKLFKLHPLFLVLAVAAGNPAKAQLTIDNAQFFIQPGATVTVMGDVTSNTNILGTGLLQMSGTTSQNINMNGFIIPNLEIKNSLNVILTGLASVSGDLLFTNGQILLGNNDLNIGSTGTITNATSTNFVVTNGTGKLIKADLGATAFNYPIGNSTSAYDPISISNSGTADFIGARSFANVLASGNTGIAFTKEVVNNSWDITEAVAGGSNLSITATWNVADELTNFDRTRGGISNYITSPAANVGWDLLNNQTGAAAGTNPYTYTRSGISNLGTFAIGTRPVLSPLLITPKVFLQGAYNTITGVMSDFLRTGDLIPITEPYTGLNAITIAKRGSGGGEIASNTIIGSASGASVDNSIVDWVMVQLHNTSDNSVISQRAALLQKDGDIVDTDGTSPVNMAGNAAGNFYVSVQHRNHLGIRTASGIALAKTTNTAYNFTNSLGQSFAGAVTNNPMATLVAGTTFGMWAGDASGNKVIRYNGPGNDENQLLNTTLLGNKATILNGYLNSDLNLNGAVRYNGPLNDENILLNIVLLGDKAAIINQPAF